MPLQNIYDDKTFFDGYRKLRQNENSANNLFETPAMLALLGDLKDKSILDLGCGYGDHCVQYIMRGAGRVVGVDISRKMLSAAREENSHPQITYLNMPMERIASLEDSFDVAASSLAVHYVEDFCGLAENVFSLLKPAGVFVFSQEHPFSTCFSGGERWTKDGQGRKIHANISGYSTDGERRSAWFVDGVQKYHRTFSSIINTLVRAGFSVEQLAEPVPDEEMLSRHPEQSDLLHKPDFLLVKAVKPS